MKKSKTTKGSLKTLTYIFIGGIGLLTIFLFSQRFVSNTKFHSLQTTPTSTSITTQEYHSELLQISFIMPNKYTVDENEIMVTLTDGSNKILIVRNSTNYTTISEYVDWISKMNNLQSFSRSDSSINGNPSSRLVSINNNESSLIYYIYVNGQIYTLSTKDRNLFTELDQIAQSFKYTP